VFGNRFSLILPTRKHSHFNKIQKSGFEMKKSIRLFKNKRGNYYVVLTHEKEIDDTPKEGKVVGIDVGVNKLMCCDDGENYTQLGTKVKEKIQKLQTKKQGSRGYEKTCREIKHYIGYSVNQMDWDEIGAISMEDLDYKSMMKIKNKEERYKGKTTRKLLGHWNIQTLTQRIQEKCKVNRVHLDFVPPFNTSRKCSRCHHVDNESRKGELYKCVKCGYEIDADNNASTNMRNLLLNHVGSVPSPAEQKRVKDECLSLSNFT
jgi:putative transposase